MKTRYKIIIPSLVRLLLIILFSLRPENELMASPKDVQNQSRTNPQDENRSSISDEDLKHRIKEGLSKILEFQQIKLWAEKHGVKTYLFGGTATSMAHFSLYTLLYPKIEESWNLALIFRSQQDLDIVLDGSPQQAEELENWISEKFPYFKGNRPSWEVRLLREERNGKPPLLHHFDFMNQHTDSQSVGLIELTGSEVKIHDLRHWDTNPSPFIEDVLKREINFYYSNTHSQTTYAQSGRNPAIIAVIRFLIKAFQFDLYIPDSELQKIRPIIDAFDPDRIKDEARQWILKNAANLIRYSRNLSASYQILDQLDLRKKLISVSPNDEVESLSWWLNKEPLPNFDVGKGNGLTAKDLGLNTITHRTKSYEIFEAITRSPAGRPLVLMSRQNKAGESAIHGDGFYTAVGKTGLSDYGHFTIQFRLKPEARLGVDFDITEHTKLRLESGTRHLEPGEFVIIKNANAIDLLPIREQVNLENYFQSMNIRNYGTAFRWKQILRSDLSLLSNSDLDLLWSRFHEDKQSDLKAHFIFLELWADLFQERKEAMEKVFHYLKSKEFIQSLTNHPIDFWEDIMNLASRFSDPNSFTKMIFDQFASALHENQSDIPLNNGLSFLSHLTISNIKRLNTQWEKGLKESLASVLKSMTQDQIQRIPLNKLDSLILLLYEDKKLLELLVPIFLKELSLKDQSVYDILGAIENDYVMKTGEFDDDIDINSPNADFEHNHRILRSPWGSILYGISESISNSELENIFQSLFYSKNALGAAILIEALIEEPRLQEKIQKFSFWNDKPALQRIQRLVGKTWTVKYYMKAFIEFTLKAGPHSDVGAISAKRFLERVKRIPKYSLNTEIPSLDREGIMKFKSEFEKLSTAGRAKVMHVLTKKGEAEFVGQLVAADSSLLSFPEVKNALTYFAGYISAQKLFLGLFRVDQKSKAKISKDPYWVEYLKRANHFEEWNTFFQQMEKTGGMVSILKEGKKMITQLSGREFKNIKVQKCNLRSFGKPLR